MSYIKLDSVSKSYPQKGRSVAALSSIDLQLEANAFVAVRGPSGCGKSTLLMTIGGMLKPDSGRVEVLNESVYDLSPDRRAAFRARSIGFVFQQFHLVPYLSVWDNLRAARLAFGADEQQAVNRRIEELIKQFGLQDRASHRPKQLSTGERQRVALARALMNSPKILLADEPTGNLDQVNAQIVLDELANFSQQGGAVLLVTHDDRASDAAETVLQMNAGAFTESGSIAQA